MIKLKPRHDFAALQARFLNELMLAITRSAIRSARELGFALKDVVDVVLTSFKERQ